MAIALNGMAAVVVFSNVVPVVLVVSMLLLVAAALALSFAAECVLPYERDWNVGHGDVRRDVAHFVVNESMSLGPLLLVPLVARVAPAPATSPWPGTWPDVVQLLLVIVVFDLGQYVFHWVSHVWRPLWRLHAVHHSVERMYGLNGIMKHPLYQLAASVTSMAPLVALGMPDRLALPLAFCTFVQLLLQHSNVDYRTGPIRRLCATAEVHRFHHLRGRAGHVNFGLFFSGWDHLFGNAFEAPRRLRTSDIGLADPGYPRDYLGQLVAPFRRNP